MPLLILSKTGSTFLIIFFLIPLTDYETDPFLTFCFMNVFILLDHGHVLFSDPTLSQTSPYKLLLSWHMQTGNTLRRRSSREFQKSCFLLEFLLWILLFLYIAEWFEQHPFFVISLIHTLYLFFPNS